jgi:hypothetical protein
MLLFSSATHAEFYKTCLPQLTRRASANCLLPIPTRGNLFLLVRLLVWAAGRGTVAQADSAARAELQGAPKQKLLQLKIFKNTIGSSTGRCLFVV